MKKSNTVAVVGAKKLKMWKQSWKTRGHEEGHNKGQWERKPVGTQVRLTKIREHQLDTTKQWNKKYRNTETRLKDQNT